MSYIIDWANSFIYVIGIIICVSPYLQNKQNIYFKIIFLCIYSLLCFIVIGDSVFHIEQYFLSYILLIVLDWLMMCWLCSKIEIWVFFYTTLYFTIYIICSDIIIYFAQPMMVTNTILLSAIINVLSIALFYLIKKKEIIPNKNMIQNQASVFSTINILFLTIFLIFFGFQILSIQGGYIIFIYIILFALWIYLIFTIHNKILAIEEREELRIAFLYNKNIEQYIDYYLKENEKIRKIKHDLNNHFLILKRLEDLQNIKKYTNEILGDIESTLNEQKVASGNIYIDACLEAKFNEYLNTTFTYDLQVQNLDMNWKNLSSLLFNLLDNAAIEANKSCGNVDLKINYDGENLVICLINTCQQEPNFSTYREGHGYGMKIIENIVEKYNGAMEITYEYNNVYINIFLEV